MGSLADALAKTLSEEESFRQMPPMDQLRPRMPSSFQPVTPQQAAANKGQNLRDLLSIIPGPGNVIAAEDAVTGTRDAISQFGQGNYGKGALATALAALSGFGAITGMPTSRMAGNAARNAKDVASVFPAYHGSPHDFDEFKLDKIGTGEGAQAYGHGLYFAENSKTAISYRDALEKKHQLNPQQGNLGDIRRTVDWLKSGRNGDAHPASGQHIDEAISDLRSDYVNGPFPNPTDAQIATHLEGNFVPRGRLYKVEIDAEPHQLLDWDKPLSEQSEEVRAALAKIGVNEDTVRPYPRLDSPVTGERILRSLQDTKKIGPDEATKLLREAGIPGIRYLDQGSRGGQGAATSNYVIFDDKLTKILSKE